MEMKRSTGTKAYGVRCPIIRKGDNLAQIVIDSVIRASEAERSPIRNWDIICLTESIVARAQGNYATVQHIAEDIKFKFGDETIGVIFPITSRNRFSVLLRGIAMGAKKIVLMLSYPTDEVGNALITLDQLDASGVNPYSDVLTLERFRELFGHNQHLFTGVDYIDLYEQIVKDAGAEVEIIFANRPQAILDYTKFVLTCDIHTRERTKRLLKEAGAETVYGLDDILVDPIGDSGYNVKFGLLGSNKSSENEVKLFPRYWPELLHDIRQGIQERVGKTVEIMVYGDGAFKDPKGGIYELADPVVSPWFTAGLKGTPNELKLKNLADDKYRDLSGTALQEAIRHDIKQKGDDLVGQMASMGTTPRQITDIVGSLADLVSGSGDKGTPIVWIQGYFDNYATE